MSMQQKPDGAVAVFVVGILSLITGCFPLAPVAWIIGSSYEAKCRAMGVAPEGIGAAGKVIGVVITILTALAILFYILVFVLLGVGAASMG